MEMETAGDHASDLEKPSKYGLKLLLSHEFPHISKQQIIPRPKQIFEMMPLSARLVFNILILKITYILTFKYYLLHL